MERKLRIINAISSRCTLKPAYEAAIPVVSLLFTVVLLLDRLDWNMGKQPLMSGS